VCVEFSDGFDFGLKSKHMLRKRALSVERNGANAVVDRRERVNAKRPFAVARRMGIGGLQSPVLIQLDVVKAQRKRQRTRGQRTSTLSWGYQGIDQRSRGQRHDGHAICQIVAAVSRQHRFSGVYSDPSTEKYIQSGYHV
jgi:hypothetical protein